jgi:hypothetical protein
VKLYGKLQAGDKVVPEAGNPAFITAKEMEKAVGCRVRVLKAYHLPIIYATDKEDALKPAHPAADRSDGRLPLVAIPSDEEMEKRKPVSGYQREQMNRTREINRPHALFVHVGITMVVKKDLARGERRKGAVRQLSGLEREEGEHIPACLDLYESRRSQKRDGICGFCLNFFLLFRLCGPFFYLSNHGTSAPSVVPAARRLLPHRRDGQMRKSE